jgi:chromosome segregation ATPase
MALFERDEVLNSINFYETLHHQDLQAIIELKTDALNMSEEKGSITKVREQDILKMNGMTTVIDLLKDECRTLSRQVVDLQQRALERSSVDVVSNKEHSELIRENEELKKNISSNKQMVSEAAIIGDLRVTIATLEANVKSKQLELNHTNEKINCLNKECHGLKADNGRLHSNVSEIKERLDQTLGLLETQLATTSTDDEAYKV